MSLKIAVGPLMSPVLSNVKRQLVLDTKNDDIYELTSITMKRILTDYPDLRKKYFNAQSSIQLTQMVIEKVNKMEREKYYEGLESRRTDEFILKRIKQFK